MFSTDNTVLLHNELSCSNNSFIILRAGSIGTEVSSADLAYFGNKVLSTLYVMGRLTYQWPKYLCKNFCHSVSD